MNAPVRTGFPTVSPYLIFRDPAAALAFYPKALGAVEISRHEDGAGRIVHAEFRVEDSTFMVSGESERFPFIRSIEAVGGSPVHFFLYVDDVDARFARALAAGGKVVMPLADQPYGRSGGFVDPFGHTWWLSTHKEPSAG